MSDIKIATKYRSPMRFVSPPSNSPRTVIVKRKRKAKPSKPSSDPCKIKVKRKRKSNTKPLKSKYKKDKC